MDRQKHPPNSPERTSDNAESPNKVTWMAEVYRPSWIDRLILIGREIIESYSISRNAVIFICVGVGVGRWRRPKARRVVLKFSYSGNIQYYIIKYGEIDKYIGHLIEAKRKLEEVGV